jgi:hypothetical protein
LLEKDSFLLTEREILNELRRIGIRDPSSLQNYFREFEEYMAINYAIKIIKGRGKYLKIKHKIEK